MGLARSPLPGGAVQPPGSLSEAEAPPPGCAKVARFSPRRRRRTWPILPFPHVGAGFLAYIKHDFDRLERALLSAADKSEREREMDSIERRRAGGGDGDGMHLSDSHASSVSMEATSLRVAARSVGRA